MARNCNDWITSYLEYVDETESPPLFKKWVAISGIASVLQRKVFLRHDGNLYPNFYIVLVGTPGVRKGTAMRPMQALLAETTGVNLCPESITGEALIRQMASVQSTYIDPLSNLPKPHSSLTVFSEELGVFMRENDTTLQKAITDFFDCKNVWEYKTKGQGTDTIHGVWLNVIGATTPSSLKFIFPQAMAVGGGLTSRILFIYGDPKDQKIIPWPNNTPERERLGKKLLADLELIFTMEGEFKLTKEAHELYIDWYIDHRSNPLFSQDELQYYNQRRQIHLLKLCMVVSASNSESMVITPEHFNRALTFIEEAEDSMPQAFSAYGRADQADMFPKLMAVIATKQKIRYSELLEMFYKDLTKDQLDQMLTVLNHMKWAKQDWEKDGAKTTVYVYYTKGQQPRETEQ